MIPLPDWLAKLANQIAAHLEPLGTMEPMGPIGCHYHLGPAGWEVTVFTASTEVVGGPHDGRTFGEVFEVDLKMLMSLFSSVTSVRWQSQSLGDEDELGAHLSIEGLYGEEPVCVRIPAVSPGRFGPGRKMLVYRRRWQEVW